jgi:hypothetical protein
VSDTLTRAQFLSATTSFEDDGLDIQLRAHDAAQRAEIAAKDAKIAGLEAALAKVGHAHNCLSRTPVCDNCGQEYAYHYGQECSSSYDMGLWKPSHETQPCNCYLSTLSDAVERGKKLLEMEAENERLRKALEDIRLRMIYVGHPAELMQDRGDGVIVPDWRNEFAIIEAALSGSRPSATGNGNEVSD